ncbi:hypothetical protein COCC4DRAFT_62989 [Bipolaris maydis ATCC 48331]|uniref:Uncharacterized protein n=2 Tax=Cochliobolus heterostrophus TaxID=5016 RepID=M2TYC2_COCH5|nr:uncharacterized protein COCC4DRAFT_62989 [Bipolaris maydis ATCC 48331]EMD86801.1 hypothetical protein COCHEDRAFT_1034561 [Bipolaris maydis C5]KAJ6203632.1 hypothetical protein PSV09DRAFT_1034561 [Bipolaris maydis]ENI03188.1 hypothetical protein COCC4DRAFT_62989 [Bipolaris maydis ATCC 48331]KAJ6267298.1 hypothetical protein PSV08DRAFT_373469 [Bipolaris maydis]KAJ6267744.1 hypothetical protein PSV08DRAFT_373803 [Bipolaris maydis]
MTRPTKQKRNLSQKSGNAKRHTRKNNQDCNSSWLYSLFHNLRTYSNPNSRKPRNDKVLRQVPGQIIDEEAVERSLCAERSYRLLESYQKCRGSCADYEHYVHKDDTIGDVASCWKCKATTQGKNPIPKEQGKFRKNPEVILRNLSFPCFPEVIKSRERHVLPVLERGKILLVKRYNNAEKLVPGVEEYAEIPITESGSVEEIMYSVLQYYRFRSHFLPHLCFNNLWVCGIEKIDETHYRCKLNL